eukprot:Blabericola_migrator_1__148@NODE_103_length_14287_cov_84_885584_g91_i0_p6_GENE_NODE_103_length_14287_cov_84_885584_g91_i0NODE_103_length_14287_cov_84_885584_g91_i0_p6_ORF_typecomplete_len196_score36_86DIL/PF01843_19/1_3WavE/PF07507_11/0_25_NODE_103_length_14287_cov_84_885584_g91_i035124099
MPAHDLYVSSSYLTETLLGTLELKLNDLIQRTEEVHTSWEECLLAAEDAGRDWMSKMRSRPSGSARTALLSQLVSDTSGSMNWPLLTGFGLCLYRTHKDIEMSQIQLVAQSLKRLQRCVYRAKLIMSSWQEVLNEELNQLIKEDPPGPLTGEEASTDAFRHLVQAVSEIQVRHHSAESIVHRPAADRSYSRTQSE